jgi:uncharacterized protein (DUF885 family)
MTAVAIVLVLFFAIPARAADAARAGAGDAAYQKLAAEFLAGHFAWNPIGAVGLGLHEYDGKSPDVRRASIDREHQRVLRFHESISAVDAQSLSPKVSLERRALLAAIEDELMSLEVMHSYERNPMTYVGAFDLTVYAKRNFAPEAQRLASVVAILEHVPASLDAARANLDQRLPRTYVTTAIEEANGQAAFFAEDLVTAFADVSNDSLQTRFRAAQAAASDAMKQYAKWLQAERLPNAMDDFAIGLDGYVRMLSKTELITQSPEQVLAIARRELAGEQARFADAARRIDPTTAPADVYKAIQHDHPTEQTLIPETAKHLEQIRRFVIDRKLVRFPSDVPVAVEPTPKFDRASTFASMDSPGALETRATEAFYYVTPTEPEWDAKHKEEWLTAMNYYTTDVVSIHEAYPGHYVQSLHLKSSDASRVDKAFGSYAFVEGWAHYCEQMVLDEGFPGTGDELVAAKYRLAQSGEALLRLCRLIVSVEMHCNRMSVDDATKFFMANCHYEEATARAEAERGTYDPGYGFYTLGKLQILKLREDWRNQEGSDFSLIKFHDELLKHGQPPIRLLREVMLRDEKSWDECLN